MAAYSQWKTRTLVLKDKMGSKIYYLDILHTAKLEKSKIIITSANLRKFQKEKNKCISRQIVLLKKQNKILKSTTTSNSSVFVHSHSLSDGDFISTKVSKSVAFLARILYLHAPFQSCMAGTGLKSWRSGPSILILSMLLWCSCFRKL